MLVLCKVLCKDEGLLSPYSNYYILDRNKVRMAEPSEKKELVLENGATEDRIIFLAATEDEQYYCGLLGNLSTAIDITNNCARIKLFTGKKINNEIMVEVMNIHIHYSRLSIETGELEGWFLHGSSEHENSLTIKKESDGKVFFQKMEMKEIIPLPY